MSQVVFLSHAGIACALPASQVVHAGVEGDEPEIRLFRGITGDEGARTLVVSTKGGSQRIAVSDARVGGLDAEKLHPIPELLRACLRMPHVVGLADAPGGLRWLIDLEAWEDR